MADRALVAGPAGTEVALGEVERRQRLGAARLGLRHVGAGNLALGASRLGGVQLARQHHEVVLAHPQDRLVAHDVGIGGDRLQQHGLLDIAQQLATGMHGGLGLADAVLRAKAAKHRLRDADRVAPRVDLGVTREFRRRRCLRKARVGDAVDRRQEARLGPRHLLVGRPEAGALGIDSRAVAVGSRHGLAQQLGRRRREQGCRRQRRQRQHRQAGQTNAPLSNPSCTRNRHQPQLHDLAPAWPGQPRGGRRPAFGSVATAASGRSAADPKPRIRIGRQFAE